MAWKTYWTVIAIVYGAYYALNIAYDLWVYNRQQKKERELGNVYDTSKMFEVEKPQIVKLEDYAVSSFSSQTVANVVDQRVHVEHQGMTPSRLIALVKEKNKIGMNTASNIFD